MGQSVLTPEENLLGKAVRQCVGQLIHWFVIGIGGKGIRQKFRNLFVGNRGFKAADDGGSRAA